MSGAVHGERAGASRWYKPYPTYKDSGVEWLGEIPAGWEVKRLKRVFRVINGSTPASNEPSFWDGDVPWATPEDLGDLNERTITSTRRNITEAGYRSCGTTLVPAGSLVLSTRAPIGHLALAGVDLCTNQGCRSLVFCGAGSREFHYYELLAARPELESLGQGSTFRELAKGMLEDVGLTAPPEHEQHAIATFLDRETARIDALVVKKERLIELLQEKRTALITRAVTKGLDPDVPMKDSGVEWLGEMPAHWNVLSLKRGTSIRYGLGEPPQLLADGLPFVRATNVTRGCIVDRGMQFVDPKDVPWSRDPALRVGDIIVVRSGAYTGDSAIIPESYDGAIAGYDMVVRVRRGQPRFLAWALLSRYVLQAQIELESMRAAQPHLNAEELGAVVTLSPPDSEQRAIAAFLDRETARLDALVARVRDAIDRLKELRTALISAAVTGKIDVREGAA